ncbi:hypothetical protein C1646_716433 [Rhizophagus diaphanus]|nr:hypothetical protein C1646_716433 [Rhizophagus diaphanus] [Rhizophagus sp. MUCL 43196]
MIIFNLYYYHLDFLFSMIVRFWNYPFHSFLHSFIFPYTQFMYPNFICNIVWRFLRYFTCSDQYASTESFVKRKFLIRIYYYLGMTDACYSDNCCYIFN